MSQVKPMTFFPLGSCRVVNTVAINLCSKKHNLLNHKDLWFTHYMQEHIQKLDLLFSPSPPVIHPEDRELIVRYQQRNHYPASLSYGIAESLVSPAINLATHAGNAVNIVLELATAKSIMILMNGQEVWGHSTNYDLISNSAYQHSVQFNDESELLDLLDQFETAIISLLSVRAAVGRLNFVYVPNIPFHQEQDGVWREMPYRIDLSAILKRHVTINQSGELNQDCGYSRKFLDLAALIDQHGGPPACLRDSDHFLPSFTDTVATEIEKRSISC